jgi:hypothetical protein
MDAEATRFFIGFKDNAVIRLSRLNLIIAAKGEQAKLNRYRLQTTTLIEISIYPQANVDRSARVILAGFRQNGSLQSAT